MTFRRYLTSHYADACAMQREIVIDLDMVARLRTRTGPQADLVSKWMLSYGLFQGISGKHRSAAVRAFLKYSKSHARQRRPLSTANVRAHFQELLLALHSAVGRGWMSAASKLLWCIYPHDVAIYDTFVHRALVVLQCVEPGLDQFERVGIQPKLDTGSALTDAVDHYTNYQAMVKHLQAKYQPLLTGLRKQYAEQYPYDIRIIDKLLWMIANPRESY